MNTVMSTVQAVLVDLDDTLYPQAEFLDAAWQAVAEVAHERGVDREKLLPALRATAAEGSDRGHIIDRALSAAGCPAEALGTLMKPLLATFRAACPARLNPYPGVVEALVRLRRRVPLALITDGEVNGQGRKLCALGLAGAFDTVVFSDTWGREFRKPHRRPFEVALERLAVTADNAVMIGDRPDKDIAGAAGLPMRAIRVLTGEYGRRPDHPGTWMTAADFPTALGLLMPYLPTGDRGAAATG
jgi:putative hydrolase of the HAD superfamily